MDRMLIHICRNSFLILAIPLLLTCCTGCFSSNGKDLNSLEYVVIKTSLGVIVVELNTDKAPISVENFLTYVDEEFYDGTIFHRVMGNMMIQGGVFTEQMLAKQPHAPIKNEWENGLKNDRGTIAMARKKESNSATCQFFINVVDNTGLDKPRESTGNAGYCVFGKLVAGMDVVDEIRAVKTTRVKQFGSLPVKQVVIGSVRRITEEQAMEMISEFGDDSSTSKSNDV